MDGSDSLHNDTEPLDKNDPMYVAEEDADPSSYILSSSNVADEQRASGANPTGYDASNDKAVYGPMLTLSEFKIRVSDAVREYFDSSDADEVVRCKFFFVLYCLVCVVPSTSTNFCSHHVHN